MDRSVILRNNGGLYLAPVADVAAIVLPGQRKVNCFAALGFGEADGTGGAAGAESAVQVA